MLRTLFLLLLILIVMVLNTSLQGENKFNSGHGVIWNFKTKSQWKVREFCFCTCSFCTIIWNAFDKALAIQKSTIMYIVAIFFLYEKLLEIVRGDRFIFSIVFYESLFLGAVGLQNSWKYYINAVLFCKVRRWFIKTFIMRC